MKIVGRLFVVFYLLSMSFYGFAQGGGADCASAVTNFITIPYTGTDSTCGTPILPIVNDIDLPGATCIDPSTTQGPDWVYYFCAPTTGTINITLSNFFIYCYNITGQPYLYPSLSVWQGCPNVGTCVAGVLPNFATPNFNAVTPVDEPLSLQVTAGQCYYILIDGYPGYCPCYKYKINVDYVPVVAVQPACSTIGFEGGNFSGWQATYGRTITAGIVGAPTPVYTPAYFGVNPANHAITSGAGVDAYGGFPVVYPGGGGFSARIGNLDTVGYGGASIEQKFNVTAANSLFTYYYSVVLEDAGAAHQTYDQPFFKAEVFDCSGNSLPCAQYLVVGGPSIPGFTLSTKPSPSAVLDVYYKPWTAVSFNLTPFVGSCVTIRYTVGDCSQGGHFAYAYVDADCRTFKVDVVPQTCPTDPVVINGPPGFENYVWTGPGIIGSPNQQNVNVNASGTYHLDMNIIGQVACGSSLDTSIAVTILQPLTTTASTNPATCGNNNGSASTTLATGGTSGYSYTWSNGASGQTITGLGSGTYTVTVTDNNGCTITSTASVNTATGPTATMALPTNVTCNAGNNGVANVTVASGTTPYTYTWSNAASSITTSTTHQITGLVAGNYTVTVSDANGCTSVSTTNITNPPVVTATPGNTNATCGGSNGSVYVTAGGGSGSGYSYLWTGGSTAQTTTGLAAGNYTVTVTDGSGCTTTTTTSISNTGGATSTMGVPTNVNCNGGSNGSAQVTAAGGSGTYTYTWSNAASSITTSTTHQITGLAAGNYVVTVDDGSGCTTFTSVTITDPPVVTAIPGNTNTTCGGTNGSVFVTAGGGSGSGYSYLWTGGSTAQTTTGLAAGNYTVTVTDGSGCTTTTITSINNTSGPTSTMGLPINVSCNGGSNGSVQVTAAGGSGTYTYTWSNAVSSITTSTTHQITGLAASSYTVTVSDVSGCTSVTTTSITDPPVVTATPGNTNATCGSANGSVFVTAGGGSGSGYSYLWTGGSTAQTTTGLAAGNYTVTVMDGSGCTTTTTTSISNTGGATATIGVPANVSCNGGSNGSAQVTAAGGSGTYTYIWSNAASGITTSTTHQITGLAAGNYAVTVDDGSGCTSFTNVTITDPPALSVTAISTSTSCGSSTGTANVTLTTGGTLGYNYSWSNSATGNTITGLAAGPYVVTVTDANSCTAISNVVVANQSGPTATALAANVTCYGGSNGNVQVTAGNGVGTYTYSWSTSASAVTTATTNQITGLAAASYTVTVSDGSSCNAISVVSITQPSQLQMGAGTIAPSCFGGCNGQAVVAPQSWLPISVVWSNSGTGLILSNLCIGTYSVTATDVNGCKKDTSVTLTQPPKITVTGNTTGANCNQFDGSAQITAAGGTPQLTYLWSNGSTNSSNTAIASGSYCVTITDLNNCQKDTCMTVVSIGGVTANISTTQAASCFGTCTGSATALGTGSSGYNYTWSTVPQQITAVATNLCAGNYTVTVQDVNNCISVATTNITEPPVLTAQTGIPTAICIGQSVVLSVTPSGGTPNYTISWAPIGPTVSPVVNTTYTVSVTDANNCVQVVQTIAVPVNPPVAVTASPVQFVCPGQSATLSATATGGNNNYTYTWMPGSILTQTISTTPASNQTYTVIVNDACGTPQAQDTVSVLMNPVPTVSFTSNTASGCAPVCVTFQDNTTISGGTIVGWQWNFGGTTSTLKDPVQCFNSPGVYNVTLQATSDKGCTNSATQTGMITVYALPIAEFTATPQHATILSPMFDFTDQSTGAVTWLWDFGDPADTQNSTNQNTSHTYSDTGTYTIQLVVTNAQNCSDTVEHTVIVDADWTFYIPNAFSPNGDGINDTFNGKGTGIKKYKMIVFDRWGNFIYQTESLNLDWDGRANGGDDIAQQDVYVWKVALIDIFDHKHNYIGHVSLVK